MVDVDENWLNWYIQEGLKEDIGEGDHTSLACIEDESHSEAYLLVKDRGVLAGLELAKYVFQKEAPNVRFIQHLNDGDRINDGDIAFELSGKSRDLLRLERFVLNTMQRMSGIATFSYRYAESVKDLDVTILDTRKTTPLLRYLEKWAVRIGGCDNYRFGLYDWIMIKDNHIAACGGISKAIQKVNDYLKTNNLDLSITVEVKNHKEILEVLECGGVRRIMFDNFDLVDLREAVALVGGKYETEASGGITLETLRDVALTRVDYISSGALTHSYRSLDLSLKIKA